MTTLDDLRGAIHDPNEFARVIAVQIDSAVATAIANLAGDDALSTLVNGKASKFFISTTQSGNAAEQSIAHGLGVVPTKVFYCTMDMNSVASVVYTEGTHTSTNVKVTTATGVLYKVLAIKD